MKGRYGQISKLLHGTQALPTPPVLLGVGGVEEFGVWSGAECGKVGKKCVL